MSRSPARVHSGHTDAFYVLEGELSFEIGRERETMTASSGAFVVVPPGVAHSLRASGRTHARLLAIHAPDGGFSTFLRGLRDGVSVEWDIAAVPADGGRKAADVIVHRGIRPIRGGFSCAPVSASVGTPVVDGDPHGVVGACSSRDQAQ